MTKPCHKCRRTVKKIPVAAPPIQPMKPEDAPRIEPPNLAGDIRRQIVGKTIRIRLKKD